MAKIVPSPIRKLKIATLSILTIGAVLVWPFVIPLLHGTSQDKVEFSRDIRPILNQNCVACHGGVRQKNDVSFIYREEALGVGKSGRRTIVPGDPDASELMARVTSTDPEERMPYHAPPLPPQQIALLRQWIQEGAKWQDYWAFEAPQPLPLPQVKRASWVRQPLDRFVLARLEKEGLEPSREADKAVLLRRVSFDLTGLPPTPREEAAYLADSSPNAYEKQVDRLLASPRYGERWASMWLDLARYADSRGYQSDLDRPGVWVYRDWVIDAFNRNLPYDQFVIKQLAGDLLPNATFEDRIATAFHRLTPDNDEGTTDDEEFRIVAVMDRVATTWSVLNALTMNCVQCHSHPYDPIRHADYYKSMAFFNTQRDADLGDDSPSLMVPKDKALYPEASRIQEEIANLLQAVETSDRQMEEKAQWKPLPIQSAVANEVPALELVIPGMEKDLAELQKKKDKETPAKTKAEQVQALRLDLAETKVKLAHLKTAQPIQTFRLDEGAAVAEISTPLRSIFELTANANLPLATAIRIEVAPLDPKKARHTPENGFIVEKVRGWVIPVSGEKKRIAFRCFVQDSERNLEAAVPAGPDPKQKPKKGDKKEEDAVPSEFGSSTKLFQTRWTVGIPSEPLHLASGSRIEVDLNQTLGAIPRKIRLSVSGDPRWTSLAEDTSRAQRLDRLKQLKAQLAKIPSVPLPVMVEQPAYARRATLEFERGNYLAKMGPDLEPDVPGIFPKLPAGAPRNRLTLAKWFFSPGQPLTARVAVNRYWEQLFGTGIVETLENFGSVGEEPSHPELLDWLALHFQNDLHWDMKALLRELVTSATYRQSAVATPALIARDPQNRLLARGPQQRLTAEMVRDQVLAASGLLNPAIGGPPVMPPQPPVLATYAPGAVSWTDATGPNRYRRAIYTYDKRTGGYPSFLIFDGSERVASLPRRILTNTPLQALVTMNDPVYCEAAEALAQRVVKETVTKTSGGSSPDDILNARLVYETRLVLSRDPTSRELTVLRSLYKEALTMPKPPALVKTSVTFSGKSLDREVPSRELYALKTVGSLLFNLDAALTR